MKMKFALGRLLTGMAVIALLVNRSLTAPRFGWLRLGCLPAAVVLLLLLVRSLPFARGRENLWVFLTVFVTTISFNAKISWYFTLPLSEYVNVFSRFCYAFLAFLGLLAAEEVTMGILARLIWKKQGKRGLSSCRESDSSRRSLSARREEIAGEGVACEQK